MDLVLTKQTIISHATWLFINFFNVGNKLIVHQLLRHKVDLISRVLYFKPFQLNNGHSKLRNTLFCFEQHL